jgi:hyperosmotically inducible periplasmic protein
MSSILRWSMAAIMALGLISGASAASLDKPASQDPIARQVRHELIMIPQLTVFDNLSYRVEGGTVILTGEVRNGFIKDEATARIKNIAGVEKIDNRIEILPASFNDDRIRREEAAAIFGYTALSRYSWGVVPSIRIVVKNGNVSLEGVVDSKMDKNIAGIRANDVLGVFSVQNNLVVER